MISFNEIPSNLRSPGVYIEFDKSRGGVASLSRRLLLIGQQLATATVPANQANLLTGGIAQSELYYGRGSMMAAMHAAIVAAHPTVEVWGLGLADDAAGVAATGGIQVTGPATATGTLYLRIAGTLVKVAVANTDAEATIATAVSAAINANTTLPVTAAVNGVDDTLVDVTCRWKGETGNTIDLRATFIQGGNAIAGVPITITGMSGGTTNPDIADAIAAMGDDWYHSIVMPYTDAANLTALETDLTSRYGAMRKIGGIAYAAYRDTVANTGTFGNTRNSFLVSCIGTGIAPQPPYIWAAANAAVAASALAADPSRQLGTLALPGIQPPDRDKIFTDDEREVLLFDGISTYTVDSGGAVRVHRQITMYQTNSAGVADASYLDITAPALDIETRFAQNNRISSVFPRHNLAEDGTNFGAIEDKIVTPSRARGELLALYREFIALGWYQDYERYAETLICEIGDGQGGGDRNRLNVQDQPIRVGNLMVWAQKTQPVL